MEKKYRMLVINPGSTSTKVSVFENKENIFTESIFHDAPELLKYESVNDQIDMRKDVILSLLSRHGICMGDIDVFVGRGGSAYSQASGVMEIDELLFSDTKEGKGGSEHPAKLGVMIAYEFASEYKKRAFTVDPTNVDELDDVARITGIKGLYRKAQSHVLNQKGIARLHSEKIGKKYEESSYIVSHIDGGITVNAHKNGRMIDGNVGAGGDGPFSPTRTGSIPLLELMPYLETHSPAELDVICSRAGGFVSHFGTSSAKKVHDMMENGDKMAKLVWDAMVYQVSKMIGAMAAVLSGNVDAILLTGGLVRYTDLVDAIRERTSFIAPVYAYPGEVEQEAMAYSVLDVLTGMRKAHKYTGKPVFDGFDF